MRWTKQDGREIETNDLPATIDAAKKAGWKPLVEVTEIKEPKKPRARRKDSE